MEEARSQNKEPVYVVVEVYRGPDALEIFENDLDGALEAGYDVIVVEPTRLGDETARWICFGNCLHKTATISGLASIASAFICSDKPYLCTSFGVLSVLCTGVYTLSWQFDPCIHYQVHSNVKRLVSMYPTLERYSCSSSVVLVRKDATSRSILHSGMSFLAAAVCMWRLYEAFK